MGKIGSSLALFVLLLSQWAVAEVKVIAVVDRNQMNVGDTFTYTIRVTSDSQVSVEQPKLPSFDGLDLLNQWSGMEARAQFVATDNGQEFKTIRTQTYSYMLQPQRAGVIRVGVAEVVAGGQSYKTQPISLQVFNGNAPNTAPPSAAEEDDEEDLFSQLLQRRARPFVRPGVPPGPGGIQTQPTNPNEAFSIQVVVDKTKVYQGEQVTASWYLVTNGAVRELDTLKYPDLRGFWKEDIEIATQLNFQTEVINGLPYRKALLASAALFPIKPGSAVIDSYKAKATVVAGNGAFGALGLGQPYTFTKASQEVKVEVLPTPNDGKPKNFSGAVGQFNVTSQIASTTVPANRPIEFKIRFEGRGNAKLIDLPALDLPKSLELYDQKSDAKFFTNGTSYKDFTLLLIPREEGQMTVPAVSVSIFDPQLHKYVEKSTQPLTLHVTAGDGSSAIPSATSLTHKEKEKSKSGFDLDPHFSIVSPFSPRQTLWVWLSAFGLVMVILLMRARLVFEWGQKKLSIGKQLKKRIRKLSGLAEKGHWREVGAEGTNTIYFVLGEISALGGANMALDKVWREMPPSLRSELEVPVTKLLNQFELLSFAPEAMIGEAKDAAKLKALVREMDKLMTRAITFAAKSEDDSSGGSPRGV